LMPNRLASHPVSAIMIAAATMCRRSAPRRPGPAPPTGKPVRVHRAHFPAALLFSSVAGGAAPSLRGHSDESRSDASACVDGAAEAARDHPSRQTAASRTVRRPVGQIRLGVDASRPRHAPTTPKA
jgi:hypothetical protein